MLHDVWYTSPFRWKLRRYGWTHRKEHRESLKLADGQEFLRLFSGFWVRVRSAVENLDTKVRQDEPVVTVAPMDMGELPENVVLFPAYRRVRDPQRNDQDDKAAGPEA